MDECVREEVDKLFEELKPRGDKICFGVQTLGKIIWEWGEGRSGRGDLSENIIELKYEKKWNHIWET